MRKWFKAHLGDAIELLDSAVPGIMMGVVAALAAITVGLTIRAVKASGRSEHDNGAVTFQSVESGELFTWVPANGIDLGRPYPNTLICGLDDDDPFQHYRTLPMREAEHWVFGNTPRTLQDVRVKIRRDGPEGCPKCDR